MKEKEMTEVGLSVLLAFVLTVTLATAHQKPLISLRAVCSNRQATIESVSEFLRLAKELKDSKRGCHTAYLQSFYDLQSVLDENEPPCSEIKFQRIANYHFRFIDPSIFKVVRHQLRNYTKESLDNSNESDLDKELSIMIPVALRQFFQAWALQVSGTCKRMLVDNLDSASKLLDRNDIELIHKATAFEGQLQTTKESASKRLEFFNLVYLPRIEGEMQPGDIELNENLIQLDLEHEPVMKRLLHTCNLRFRPIYSKLVMPIVRLSKLGYEYVGHKLDDINLKLEKEPQVRRWLILTKVCEVLGNYELVKSDDKELEKINKLTYEPSYEYHIQDTVWLLGADAIKKELDRLIAKRSTGLRRFGFSTSATGRKVVNSLDPNQSAWYRRNSNSINSILSLGSTAVAAFNFLG